MVEHNRFSLLYIANFHYHVYIWFKTDPAHTALDLLWLDLGCDVRPGMVQRRGAKPNRPDLHQYLNYNKQVCQRYKYYMYYIWVQAVGFSVRNHPPLPRPWIQWTSVLVMQLMKMLLLRNGVNVELLRHIGVRAK